MGLLAKRMFGKRRFVLFKEFGIKGVAQREARALRGKHLGKMRYARVTKSGMYWQVWTSG